MLVSIRADVYCDHVQDTTPMYRVYVDQDLLTERSWIWPAYEIYIRENIEVELESGTHELRVERLGDSGNFTVKNITVNGQNTDNLTFIV